MSTPFKDRKPPSDAEIREYFQILKDDGRSRVFAPLAEALIRRGRLDEAEQICRHGIGHNPDFSDGHLALGRVLFYRFRYQEALEEVKLTLALDGKNIEAYLIAAEIFLARSQHKAASDACLKALDMDPDNVEAIRLLERVGEAPQQQSGAAAPAGQGASRFKATAGTAPSRRQMEPDAPPSMTNPFQQLMQELEGEAADRLDLEQPFTALSSGSQTDIPDQPGLDPDFEVPTAPVERPAEFVPSLPSRPPTGNPVPGSQPAPQPAAAAAPAPGGPEFDKSTLPPTPVPGVLIEEPPAPVPGVLIEGPPTPQIPQVPQAPQAPEVPNPLDDLLAQVPGSPAPEAVPDPAPLPTPSAPSDPGPPLAPQASPQGEPVPSASREGEPAPESAGEPEPAAVSQSAPPSPNQPAPAAVQAAPTASPSAQQTTSAWRRVDAAQAVIDAYRDRIPESDLDEPPLKIPRLSALLPLLGVLALLTAAVLLILTMVPSEPPPKPASGQVEAPTPPAPLPPEALPGAVEPQAQKPEGPQPEAEPVGDTEGFVAEPLPDEDPAPAPSAEEDEDIAPVAIEPPEAPKKLKQPKKKIRKRTKRKRRRPPRRRRKTR